MQTKNILIRPEIDKDKENVFLVNESAFGRKDEALLVDRLRETDAILLSLVAVQRERIIGHVLFTKVELRSPENQSRIGAGLGPVAVSPDCQHKGVGDTLIRSGISHIQAAGAQFVVVLGHPNYYPRFGFEISTHFNIKCQWKVPEEAFMALELRPGALKTSSGTVFYAPEFEGV